MYLIYRNCLHAGIDLFASLMRYARCRSPDYLDGPSIWPVAGWIGRTIERDTGFSQSRRQVNRPAVKPEDRASFAGCVDETRQR